MFITVTHFNFIMSDKSGEQHGVPGTNSQEVADSGNSGVNSADGTSTSDGSSGARRSGGVVRKKGILL